MGNQKEAETPQQMKERARKLRDCARRARGLAGALGPYLDKTVNQATASPPIWNGPYAETTTLTLGQRQSHLRDMAGDLLKDVARWESEASRIEDEATKQAAKKPGGHH
ncbi:hypothetical protein [Streptomyces sp. NBC_00859]|uniref:hypothetical protein n=1 Tax=Streptomyces sp. NBC_00859 TaxID=2903682 RepID=UPI003862D447|nr:hypothetical protein OG584_10460 [Streptomyces sp. NBC_00859]